MQFTGHEDHKISLADARQLTANFREKAEGQAMLGGYFGKAAISSIIEQQGCVGIRIYYGILEDGEPTFVLCGVNADGDDLTNGELAEVIRPCPPYCSINTTELISD
jgi:hypothetical protein